MNCLAGIVSLDGAPAEAGAVRRPMEVMAHDAAASYAVAVHGPAVFGCQTGSAHAHLGPRLLERGDLMVAADARIDDRARLCAALEWRAAACDEATDAELILASYERWGTACPTHLVGDYAFAIWNGARRELFCARDHIGARPLYYALVGNQFVFASDIRGVLAFDGIPALVDEAEVARYLLHETRRYREPFHTLFAHVRKLPFGHRLRVDLRGLHVERHWQPEHVPDVNMRSADDYAQRLFELVNAALTDRLRGAASVGVHLSGGLDSSSLAALTARTLRSRGEQVMAFSWSPAPTENWRGPEHDRIEAVGLAEGIVPLYLPHQMSETWQYEHDIAVKPTYDTFAERPVVEAAAEAGVDVIVSGWGGDEAASFNGRGIAAGYIGHGQWSRLGRYCWQRAGAPAARSPVGRLFSAGVVLWSEACRPWLPRTAFRLIDRRARGARASLIAADFLERIRPHIRPPIELVRDRPDARANLINLYYAGAVSGRLDSWSEFRTERNVTHVFPLTDRRVLEFIYGAPAALHVQRGVARYLFRQAMASVSPALVWRSTKREGRGVELARASCAPERDRLLADLERPLTRTPHPWVDIPRLRLALKAASIHTAPPVPVDHALNALRVWKRWCAPG